jgi:hypothetical protein
LALVPDGAHLLVSVDLRRLRRYARARGWRAAWAGLRASGALSGGIEWIERLPGLGEPGRLARADVLVIAVWLEGSPSAKVLVAARGADAGSNRGVVRGGEQGSDRRAARGAEAGSERGTAREPPPRRKGDWGEYRGVPLRREAGVSTAMISARTVIAGPRPLVRQAVDLLRAMPGNASVREDRRLMALWAKVAGPRAGRAPVLAAVAAFPAALQKRLTERTGLAAPPRRAGLRLSLGRWVTARGFLDCPGTPAARKLIGALRARVQRAGRSPRARALGATGLLSLLAVHHEGGRVHLQWIAPAARLAPLRKRLEALAPSEDRGKVPPHR